MGYSIQILESDVFIAAEQQMLALFALQALGGEYAWVSEDFKKAKTLEDALFEWGYEVTEDDDGNIVALWKSDSKIGDEFSAFKAMAPYVKAGSHIDVFGEDGCIWQWYFTGTECVEREGRVVFDE